MCAFLEGANIGAEVAKYMFPVLGKVLLVLCWERAGAMEEERRLTSIHVSFPPPPSHRIYRS